MIGVMALALPAAAQVTPRPATEFVLNLLNKKQALLSSYKGKTVVFACLSATCPHCQAFVPELNAIQKEYAAKGVAVVGTLFNPDAEVTHPGFVQSFKPEFPLGWSTRELVHAWLGFSVMKQTYVPIVAFIDKKGSIVAQYTGDDPFMKEPGKATRVKLNELLGGAAGAAAKKAPVSSKK